MECFSALEHAIPNVDQELGPLTLINGTHERMAITNGIDIIPPAPDCEVYLSGLPQELTVDILISFARKCGKIYKLRMMHEYGGKQRGYAFITYFSPLDAQRAVYVLSHTFFSGKPLRIAQSYNKRTLFVYGFNNTLPICLVRDELSKLFPAASRIYVVRTVENVRKTTGKAFIVFPNHTVALNTKRFFNVGLVDFMGQEMSICWAKGEYCMKNVPTDPNVLLIRSIPASYKKSSLMEDICQVIDRSYISRFQLDGDALYLTFFEVWQKVKAASQLKDIIICGNRLYTYWNGFIQELNDELRFNFDNILRLKCIANSWDVPIIVVGQSLTQNEVQVGMIIMRRKNKAVVLFFEVYGLLLDVRTRMHEAAVNIVLRCGGFPNKNYIVTIRNYAADVVGEIPDISGDIISLKKHSDLRLSRILSELFHLKTAVHSLLSHCGATINSIVHQILTYQTTYPVIDLQLDGKVFFCLVKQFKPNPCELRCNLSDERIHLVLCNVVTQNNFTACDTKSHGFTIHENFNGLIHIGLLRDPKVDLNPGLVHYQSVRPLVLLR